MRDELSLTVIATGFGEKSSRLSFSRGLPNINREQQLKRITERDVRVVSPYVKPPVTEEPVLDREPAEEEVETSPEIKRPAASSQGLSIPKNGFIRPSHGEGSFKPDDSDIDYEQPAFLRYGQGGLGA
jgi:hypothetical protein